jgi:hypothetical protein
LAAPKGLQLDQVLLGDRVDGIDLQRSLIGLDRLVQLAQLGIGLAQPVEGVLVRAEAVDDAPIQLDGFCPLTGQGQLDCLIDVLGAGFDAFGELGYRVPS